MMPYLDGSATFGSLRVLPFPRESMSISFKDKNSNNYVVLEEFFKYLERFIHAYYY